MTPAIVKLGNIEFNVADNTMGSFTVVDDNVVIADSTFYGRKVLLMDTEGWTYFPTVRCPIGEVLSTYRAKFRITPVTDSQTFLFRFYKDSVNNKGYLIQYNYSEYYGENEIRARYFSGGIHGNRSSYYYPEEEITVFDLKVEVRDTGATYPTAYAYLNGEFMFSWYMYDNISPDCMELYFEGGELELDSITVGEGVSPGTFDLSGLDCSIQEYSGSVVIDFSSDRYDVRSGVLGDFIEEEEQLNIINSPHYGYNALQLNSDYNTYYPKARVQNNIFSGVFEVDFKFSKVSWFEHFYFHFIRPDTHSKSYYVLIQYWYNPATLYLSLYRDDGITHYKLLDLGNFGVSKKDFNIKVVVKRLGATTYVGELFLDDISMGTFPLIDYYPTDNVLLEFRGEDLEVGYLKIGESEPSGDVFLSGLDSEVKGKRKSVVECDNCGTIKLDMGIPAVYGKDIMPFAGDIRLDSYDSNVIVGKAYDLIGKDLSTISYNGFLRFYLRNNFLTELTIFKEVLVNFKAKVCIRPLKTQFPSVVRIIYAGTTEFPLKLKISKTRALAPSFNRSNYLSLLNISSSNVFKAPCKVFIGGYRKRVVLTGRLIINSNESSTVSIDSSSSIIIGSEMYVG